MRQRFHAVPQIALYVIEADPSESQSGLLLASRFGNDHNGPGGVQKGTGPCRVLAAEPDIDTARHVSLGILRRIADIQNLSAGVPQLQNFLQLHRLQNLFQSLLQRGALASVQDRVVREVCRGIAADPPSPGG